MKKLKLTCSLPNSGTEVKGVQMEEDRFRIVTASSIWILIFLENVWNRSMIFINIWITGFMVPHLPNSNDYKERSQEVMQLQKKCNWYFCVACSITIAPSSFRLHLISVHCRHSYHKKAKPLSYKCWSVQLFPTSCLLSFQLCVTQSRLQNDGHEKQSTLNWADLSILLIAS